MGLYTRAEYERDLEIWDRKSAQINTLLLAGAMNGFDAQQAQREIDRVRRSLENKLLATRVILGDQEAMRKSYWFAWVAGAYKRHTGLCPSSAAQEYRGTCNCKGPWEPYQNRELRLRHQSRNWVLTTLAHLQRLLTEGVTLLPAGGFKRDWTSEAQAEKPEVEAQEALPEERQVTLSEGFSIIELGGSVMLRPNGRECALTRDWALLEQAPKAKAMAAGAGR